MEDDLARHTSHYRIHLVANPAGSRATHFTRNVIPDDHRRENLPYSPANDFLYGISSFETNARPCRRDTRLEFAIISRARKGNKNKRMNDLPWRISATI